MIPTFLLLVGLSAGCDALTFLHYSWFDEGPSYSGELALPGLTQNVTVTFDDHAVPHVQAKTEADALFAQGYLHARERLFQMELLRMAAAGRLSELFGNHPRNEAESLYRDTLATDRMLRLFGFAHLAQESAQGLDEESRLLGQAYVDGINVFLARGEWPVELKLLHHHPQAWTVADVLAIARLQGFQLSSNMVQESLRYLLRAELGPRGQQAVMPGFNFPGPEIIARQDKDYRDYFETSPRGEVSFHPEPIHRQRDEVIQEPDPGEQQPKDRPFIPQPPTRPNDEQDYDSPEEVQHPDLPDEQDEQDEPSDDSQGRLLPSRQNASTLAAALLDRYLAFSEKARFWSAPDASNSWALTGRHTKNKQALLANDPHLAHSAPGIFYAMALSTPQWQAVGVSIPGTPGILIGRNRHLAWSLTTTMADTQDLYLELPDETNPDHYMTEHGPEPFTLRNEIIRIKTDEGFREESFTVRETRHGPVLNDLFPGLPENAPLLALKTTMPGATGDVSTLIGLLRARDLDAFREALLGWDYPIQNWVGADNQGRIGYFPAGRVPKRKGWDGTMPVPGFSGAFEWDGYIPYDQLPQLFDPPSGRLVTANNRVLPSNDYPYPYQADAQPGYRAERILEQLHSKQDWAITDTEALQRDVYSKQAEALLPVLLHALEQASLRENEHKVLYHLKTWDRYVETDSTGASLFYVTRRLAWEATFKDDLSASLYKRLSRIKYVHGLFDRLWLEEPNAAVFDIKETRVVETRDDILVLAFRQAVQRLGEQFGPDASGWTWGRLHTLIFAHPFGQEERLAETFNSGPMPLPGARGTVWAETGLWPDNELHFPVKYGPAMRMIADMADADSLYLIVDLGQSGHATAKSYRNGLEAWRKGGLWKLSMNADDTKTNPLGTLHLLPAEQP